MNEVYIFAAKRSAIGAFGGSLSNISAPDISAEVIKNLADQEIISKVGEVIFGNVLSAGIGQNPARIASVKAGIRENVPASTINQVCGSGMRSVAIASDLLALGKRNLMVVGGMENMSQSPYLLRKHRFGNRLGHDELIDSMVNDGLWCTLTEQHMGCTAENVAYKYKISREEADVFALESQKKALQAIEKGKFTGQIVAIEVQEKKGSRIFDVDEQPRKDTAIEILLKLKPAFKEPGLVTAGNSSTINDGAAALLLGNQNAEKNYGLKPLARVVDYAVVALDPNFMGMGASLAAKQLLKQTKIKKTDIDLWEINEAFATQSLAVIKDLRIDKNLVNVNGGAIALGHPIGASGARILVTLIHELVSSNKKFGLASLCIGGGQGIAMIIERL